MIVGRHIIIFSMLFSCGSWALAQNQQEKSIALDSIIVKANKYASALKSGSNGVIVWDMKMMNDLPKMMGNADPVHFTQMLPGIQTNSEYQGGVHIEGSESSHNATTIGGVNIYNINHLLGFFSTFNASHYSNMKLDKSGLNNITSNRIGGSLNMNPVHEFKDEVSGEASLGAISSQGTIHFPLGNRTNVSLSLRASYINLLYSRWLSNEHTDVNYSFYDSNLSIQHLINAHHTLLLDYYGGNDHGKFAEVKYLSVMKARWGNYMGALHWIWHTDNFSMRNTIYTTNYFNRFKLQMQALDANMPSDISDLGYQSEVQIKRWKWGAEAILHHIQPQHLTSTGVYNISMDTPKQKSVEATAGIAYTQPLWENLEMKLGVKVPVYKIDATTFVNVDPSWMMAYNNHTYEITLTYALKHQYLFQTGFSDVGLPTEFWLSVDKDNVPQYSHQFRLACSSYLNHRKFKINADLFYHRLFHQIEYQGNVLDLVNQSYAFNQSLYHGNGYNYGGSIMLQKMSGMITGWVSYTYMRARRRFNDMGTQASFPSSHERPHEVNMVLTYSPSARWSFSTTMVYASGQPFTAPSSLSLLNGNIITEYGVHNGNRLRPYFRLDASANYKWKGRKLKEQGLNLSLNNITCHENDLFWRVRTVDGQRFAYQPVGFMMRILPSISYFFKF